MNHDISRWDCLASCARRRRRHAFRWGFADVDLRERAFDSPFPARQWCAAHDCTAVHTGRVLLLIPLRSGIMSHDGKRRFVRDDQRDDGRQSFL